MPAAPERLSTPETTMKRSLAIAVAPAAPAALVAGCGGGSQSGTASAGPAYGAAAPASKPAAATVATAHTRLGTVLVDGQGRTLYLFEKDKGAASRCYGACASVWPPLTTEAKAVAGGGIATPKLGSSKRTNGKTAVTYGGHPLYTYAGDAKPGDVKGQGLDQFGAEWYALAPSGHKIDNGS
jgi:predicted lipoprotein with Yx(FWY)xxD motif